MTHRTSMRGYAALPSGEGAGRRLAFRRASRVAALAGRGLALRGTCRVPTLTGRVFALLGAGLGMGLVLWAGGCGEQDLYEPPTSPFSISGRLAMPTEVQDVAILDTYAYLAAGQSGLQVVDISDPSAPTLVLWLDTPKYADAIAVARTYDPDGSPRDMAFLVEGTEGILPFDITPVPDSIVDLRQGTSAYAGNAVCVKSPEFVSDPYVLFLADSWRAVTGFLSAPDNPGFLDQRVRAVPYGYAQDLALSADGTHLYVADDEMGVTILDATGVEDRRLEVIGNIDTPDNAMGIAVEDSYVYVADDESGLQVFRAGVDYLLEHIATLALPGRCEAIDVRNHVVFMAAGDAGLHVVDVRDPLHPLLLGSVPTSDAVAVAVGANNVVCVADVDEGLIVFRGPDLGADPAPPAVIADLSARLLDTSSLRLRWTAPGDDGATGTASLYDLRSASAPITLATWEQTQKVVRSPLPHAAGTPEETEVTGLAAGDTLYFAIRTEDDAAYVSDISNIVMTILTVPALTGGDVDPDSAITNDTVFTFQVTYTDAEGDAPVVRNVVIDGVAHEMTAAAGGNYANGVRFSYATTLGFGSHDHKFSFDDGHGPLVETPTASGPDLPPSDPFAFEMLSISVGTGETFTMGSPAGELGRDDDETAHAVTLTRDFLLGATEVNQALYTAITGDRPSIFSGSSRPVESITWYDALAFCNALSAHDQLENAYTLTNIRTEGDHIVAASVTWDHEANGYRLPTEAEWEYACRAGAVGSLSGGELTVVFCEIDPVLDALGWYCGNADAGTGPRTHPAGEKAPSEFGLYDMHGNVWEYCWDLYAAYPEGTATDPSGPAGDEPGARRVVRGGSWYYHAAECRSASREGFWSGSRENTVGLRLARNGE